MGNIRSRLTRQFYRFNAENRAQKIISSKEIRPAPKHEKTLKEINTLEKGEVMAPQVDFHHFC